jgi:signal transduction histidine kinase
LLSNAVKFTHRGQVRVELRWSEGKALLRVTDTGVGMAPHELPQVLEKPVELERLFQTVARTMRPAERGPWALEDE